MSTAHETVRSAGQSAEGSAGAPTPRAVVQVAPVAPISLGAGASGASAKQIDELMERASAALVRTDYFDAESLCLKAMERAVRAQDFDRVSRIIMPLQEARRQRRHEAIDAGRVTTMRELSGGGVGAKSKDEGTMQAGCVLIEPPMIGADARTVRAIADRKRVAMLVLVREPTAASGRWPIVAVGGGEFRPAIVRVQVEPPAGGEITPAWFLATQEALGDAAIAKVKSKWPADHRVLDLLEYLEGIPDHEKLHQAVASAAREAMSRPPTPYPRRRGMFDDPFSF